LVVREPILIVEDDESVRDALVAILQQEGYPVGEAGDGAQALALLREGLNPCLILLDLMMPRMDGWQFRREQLKDSRLAPIPVVVLSASNQAKRLAETPGVVDVFMKPVDLDQLLHTIERYCPV
jgi:two-component system response regulator MprA